MKRFQLFVFAAGLFSVFITHDAYAMKTQDSDGKAPNTMPAQKPSETVSSQKKKPRNIRLANLTDEVVEPEASGLIVRLLELLR